MKDTTTVSATIGGEQFTFETGLLARQAAGSIMCSLGNSRVFCAVTNKDEPREGIDFFPLQVEYREKFYAAGRFPGGYFKREARPSEKEILTSRNIDRPIRPLFPAGYHNDVQINSMVLSCDGINDTDIVAVNAASAALHISEVPFMGPIGCVRVGRVNGEFVINPSDEQRLESELDLIYVGTRERFLMMEGSAEEISEEDFLAAMKRGHEECVKLVDAQIELRRALGKEDKVIVEEKPDPEKMAFLYEQRGDDLKKVLLVTDKLERQAAVKEIKADLLAKAMEKWPEEINEENFITFFDAMEIDLVRKNILVDGNRVGGRDCETIRELSAQIGILPRTHGSAVFNRGETSALGSITLGTKKDAQTLDAVTGGATSKNFLLHYNFPPYCVGEVGRLGGLGRREIGHGNLAERSLAKVVPADYPYSVRVVSDIMGSNGSSSMASICVGALAMMDAGIPIKAPVAGVSVGLFTNEDESKKLLVTDILGSEDHCGDMDFKVAGTAKGITGFQVDLKLRGLPWDVVESALQRAKEGRLEIIEFMKSVIAEPREDLAEHAPRITTLSIPTDKIGALIGPGGANIRRICEVTGAQIDIEEDGTVSVFAKDGASLDMAKREVEAISAEAEEGKLYEGTVTGIKDFGAFVEIMPGKDGLCHISELADHRIGTVDEICKVGDKMWVMCIAVDDRGRIKLSRREAMRKLDEEKNEE